MLNQTYFSSYKLGIALEIPASNKRKILTNNLAVGPTRVKFELFNTIIYFQVTFQYIQHADKHVDLHMF